MIAVDWSHIKQLTTFDGKKIRVEDKETLAKRISRKRNPEIVIEEECPLSLIYYFLIRNIKVFTINNHTCNNYRLANNIIKTDENDVRIIWQSANSGIQLSPITLESKPIHLYDLYH